MAISKKELTISRWGWKRVAKNTEKFGWVLEDVWKSTKTTEKTSYDVWSDGNTVHVDEHTSKSKFIRMELTFSRDDSRFVNLRSIFWLELLYNIFFTIRRFLGGILYIFNILMLISLILQVPDVLTTPIGMIWWISLIIWAILIVLEGVLARIADNRLIYKNENYEE